MRFLRQTRRHFYFAIDDDKDAIDEYGIKTIDGQILFPRYYPDEEDFKAYKHINYKRKKTMAFADIKECEDYFNHVKSEDKMKFVAGQKQVKRIYDLQTKAVSEISDEDWQLMQKRMRNPEKFEKEDFRVFEDWLANNWRDRDGERFTYKILQAFDSTIPGKQRLIGHARGGAGIGRYFKSKLVPVTVQEAIKIMGEHAERKGLEKILKQIVERDGNLYCLVPSFYVRLSGATNEMVDDMDAGIGGDSSIGFRADGLEAVKDEEGNVMYHEFIDNGGSEAVEGSDVWLGSQRGARVIKEFDGELDMDEFDKELTYDEAIKPFANEHACRLKEPGQYSRFARKNCAQKHENKCIDVIYGIKENKSEIQSLRYNKKIWTADDARSHCKNRGGIEFEAAKEAEEDLAAKQDNSNNGDNTMKFRIESFDWEKEVDLTEDSLTVIQDEIEAKVADMVNGVVEKDTKITELEKTIEDQKSRLTVADSYEQWLKDEIVKYAVFLKQTENDEAKIQEHRGILDALTCEQLKSQRDSLIKQINEKYPEYGILPTNTEIRNADNSQGTDIVNPHRYQEPVR